MSSPLRVLLIEDSRLDQLAFEDYVQAAELSYDYQLVASVSEAHQTLSTHVYDVILADYRLPDGTALDILATVDETPIIIVTGSGDEEIAVQAMKAGAYDYLTKDPQCNYLKILPLVIENTLKRKYNDELAREQAAALAAAEERQRIARELHDTLSQTLFSMHAIAKSFPNLTHDHRVQPLVDELNQLAISALAEMSVLLTELRPGRLEQTDLQELLSELLKSRNLHTRTQLELQQEIQGRIPLDVQVTVYRIAQEALNNIIKHAKARLALFKISGAENQVQLLVQDDGVGFDERTVKAENRGLGIMQERARALDAKLSISSAPGQGTTITFDWTKV